MDSDFAGDLDGQSFLTKHVFSAASCAVGRKAQLRLMVALSATTTK